MTGWADYLGEGWVGSPKFPGMEFIAGAIKPIKVYDSRAG